MEGQVPKIQVLKHPNGKSPYWYLRYRISIAGQRSKEIWKSTKTTVRREAEQQRRQLERKFEQADVPSKELSWDDFVQDFLNGHANRKAATTQLAYKECLATFGRTAKPGKVGRVNLGMLEDFANSRMAEGVSPSTVNKELRHIRAAIKWAHRRSYIRTVPHFTTAFIKVDDGRPRTIPEDHFARMVKALKSEKLKLEVCDAGWWRVFLYFAYYLGLRRGELLGLCWKDVSFADEQLCVRAGTSKSRRDRTIPLRPEIAELLIIWQKTPLATPNAEVLPWPHDSFRPLYYDWHAIQDAAGFSAKVHYVPHDCRSSCATELGRAGVDAAVAQKILGHSNITTTTKFYFDAQQLVKDAIQKRPVKEIPES